LTERVALINSNVEYVRKVNRTIIAPKDCGTIFRFK